MSLGCPGHTLPCSEGEKVYETHRESCTGSVAAITNAYCHFGHFVRQIIIEIIHFRCAFSV